MDPNHYSDSSSTPTASVADDGLIDLTSDTSRANSLSPLPPRHLPYFSMVAPPYSTLTTTSAPASRAPSPTAQPNGPVLSPFHPEKRRKMEHAPVTLPSLASFDLRASSPVGSAPATPNGSTGLPPIFSTPSAIYSVHHSQNPHLYLPQQPLDPNFLSKHTLNGITPRSMTTSRPTSPSGYFELAPTTSHLQPALRLRLARSHSHSSLASLAQHQPTSRHHHPYHHQRSFHRGDSTNTSPVASTPTSQFIDLTIDEPEPAGVAQRIDMDGMGHESENGTGDMDADTPDEEDDDVIIDEVMTNKNVCYGMIKSEIIIFKAPRFVVDEGYEPVKVVNEGRRENHWSMRVMTRTNEFYGWLPFSDTDVFGPLMDQRRLWMDAVIPRNKTNPMHTPILLILYGRPHDTEHVGGVLAEGLKYLKEPPFFNPETRYQNPHNSVANPPRSMRYLSAEVSPSRQQSQTHRDISLLLDSIPSEVNTAGEHDIDDLPAGEGKIDGLNIELMRHQAQGVAWMRDREEHTLSCGGILADMGLGKTIQTLALIVTDLATPEKPKRRTTLIVCPLALIRQWESELMGKAKQDIIKVYVHHGLGRTKDHAELIKYDVVITTYQVVASEYPESRARGRGKKKRQDEGGGDSSSTADDAGGRPKKGRGPQPVQLGAHPMVIDLDDGVGGEDSGAGSGVESGAASPGGGGAADSGSETPFSAAAGFGPLFRVHWYRIVLDEAQQIKNRNTRAALSCSALEAEKRWCLTGTPLQNNIDELFSLIHFLRIKPFCDIQKFREQISKPMQSGQSEIALGRLKALLKAMMLRRTKHILKQNHTRMMEARNGEAATSEDQTMVEAQEWNGHRSSESSSAIEDADTDGDGGRESGAERGEVKVKMEAKVKVEGASATGAKSEEMAFLNLPSRNIEIIEAEFTEGERELYDRLNQKTKSTMNRMMKNGKLERNYLNILCLLLRLRQACDHPQLVFKALSNDTDALEMETGQPGVGNATVSAASANRANATAAANHAMMMYVGAGLGWNLNGAAADQAMGSLSDVKNKKKCGICLDTLSDPSAMLCKDCTEKLLKPGNATDSSLPPSLSAPVTSDNGESTAATTPVPAAAAMLPLSSTKIIKLLEVLEDTRTRFPGQKTIVFSQFTSMLDLLEEPLKKAEFRFCRYDGTMPNHLRERSIDMLKNDPDTTVMLISLKCGSLGLNLTAANRVVLMDVWWNPAVEDQAIDRVHRIGQRLEVHVTRLKIKDTVEEKIIALQEKKRKLIDGALGDKGAGFRLNKLTTQEIQFLFS